MDKNRIELARYWMGKAHKSLKSAKYEFSRKKT